MNNNLQTSYEVINEYYNDYLTQPKRRNIIENNVRSYVNNLPDEIYLEASNGSASGLCSHGFFESDLQKVLSTLEKRINQEPQNQ